MRQSWIHASVCALTLMTLVACGGQMASPVERAAERLSLELCQREGIDEPLLCGSVTVPERRGAQNGRTLELSFVVVPALTDDPRPDALFDLAPAAGVASSEAATLYTGYLEPLRYQRDVVLVDQRGTGSSQPLHCPQLENAPRVGPLYPVESVKACRNALVAAGADLTAFNSIEAVDDLDAVREHLGYAKINLIGVGYGSRLGALFMRRHADRVRAAVLIAPAPLDKRTPLYHARDGQRALDRLFADCAADEACHAAYPDPRADLATTLDRIAAGGLRVAAGGRAVEPTREGFLEELRGLLYSPLDSRQVPQMLHAAAAGDFTPFSRLVPASGGLTEGTYLSVTCSEETGRITDDQVGPATKGTLFGDSRVREQRKACAEWTRAEIPEAFFAPVESAVPTLAITGENDPVSPPEWGEALVRGLSDARHLVVPGMAHDIDGVEPAACLDGIVRRFIDAPDPAGLDVACVDSLRPVGFATGPVAE